MYAVDMHGPSPEFAHCWRAAGSHLNRHGQERISWLKSDLNPPFLEHLSFRLGNQLFFVRIEPVASLLEALGSREGLVSIAGSCKGHACLLPMVFRAKEWKAEHAGWGLIELASGMPLDPPSLISGEKIEMTDWELHDMAVQVVRDQVRRDGREIMSAQRNPSVDPSIWFVGDRGPEWIVVRAARYPTAVARRPANLAAIAANCAHLSKRGNFASVALANSEDSFAQGEPPLPLWRGDGMIVRFQGLELLA